MGYLTGQLQGITWKEMGKWKLGVCRGLSPVCHVYRNSYHMSCRVLISFRGFAFRGWGSGVKFRIWGLVFRVYLGFAKSDMKTVENVQGPRSTVFAGNARVVV